MKTLIIDPPKDHCAVWDVAFNVGHREPAPSIRELILMHYMRDHSVRDAAAYAQTYIEKLATAMLTGPKPQDAPASNAFIEAAEQKNQTD